MGGDVGLVFLQEDFCTQFETFETIVDLYVDFGVYDGAKTTVAEYEEISDSIGGEGCIIIYVYSRISVMVIGKDYNINGRR